MENDNSLTPNENIDNSLDVLFEEFGHSMMALQVQDLNSSEKSLIKAKNIYRNISSFIPADENIPYKILVNYIEITTRLLRSTYYSFDERFKKSLEELDAAKKICAEVNSSFALVPKNIYDEDEFGALIDMFKSMFIFFERIVIATHGIIKGALDKSEGKYVDEIQLLRNSALELRQMDNHNFGVVDSESNNLIVMMISMLNKFAEINEKKAERLEEKRKKIEFMPPMDKKVFIVHGHNEGVLRELKEMLKSDFKTDPIILSDEIDNGNTLIEKFEHYGRLCAFAFVIVTPDDWVENKKKKYFQARPNVLFELGWFCGRYGRDKVRILRQKETPLPSDLNGLVTIDFNEKLEEAFRRIGNDLEKAGIIDEDV